VDNDELLSRHGLQVTAQRLAVLRAVSDPQSTAEDTDKAVPAELGAISRQAVYSAPWAFRDVGFLRRIQPAGSPARYENWVGDISGYEIDEAVIYWGRCPECAAARYASSDD
jgi:Fur family transcriptional regulator, stress-responsive regulator